MIAGEGMGSVCHGYMCILLYVKCLLGVVMLHRSIVGVVMLRRSMVN